MIPTLGNRLGILINMKNFWRRCRGVATNQVDLKRARGNLQLHCKSGTLSTFLFIFVFSEKSQWVFLGRSKRSACRFGLATSNTD